MRSEK